MQLIPKPYMLAWQGTKFSSTFRKQQIINFFQDEIVLTFLNNCNGEFFFFSVILFCTGCRFSEVYSIRKSDISPSGFLFIRGRKGSRDRTLYFPLLAASILDFKQYTKNDDRIFTFSYKQFYTFTKRNIPFVYRTQRGSNQCVTHFFRYYFLDRASSSDPFINLSDLIGHRSSNSTNFYLEGLNHG